MAQKVNPISLRVHKNKYTFDSIYFNYYNYASLFIKNLKIKNYIHYILKKANVSSGVFVIIHLHTKTFINVFYCIPNKKILNVYTLNKNISKKKIIFLKKNIDIENYTKIKKKHKNFLKNKNYKKNVKMYKILNYLCENNEKVYAIQNKKNCMQKTTKNKNMYIYLYNFHINTHTTNILYKNYTKYNYYKKILNVMYIKFFIIKYFYNVHVLNNYIFSYNNIYFLSKIFEKKKYKIFLYNFLNKKNIYFMIFTNFLNFRAFTQKKYVFTLTMQKMQNTNLKNVYKKNKKYTNILYKKKTENNVCTHKFYIYAKNYAKYKKILYLYSTYNFLYKNVLYIRFIFIKFLLKKKLYENVYIENMYNYFLYNKYYILYFFLKKKLFINKKTHTFLYLQKYANFFFNSFLKKNKIKKMYVENILFFNIFSKQKNYNSMHIFFFKYVLTNYMNKKLKSKYNTHYFKKNKKCIHLYIFNKNAHKQKTFLPIENKKTVEKNIQKNVIFLHNTKLYNFKNYAINYTFKNTIQNNVYNSFLRNNSLQFFKTNNVFTNAFFLMDLILYMYEKKYSFFKIKKLLLKNVLMQKKLNIKGIKLVVSGVVGGKSKKAQKAKTQSFIYGENSLHVFSEKIDFLCKKTLTSFGILGIKLWICYDTM